MKIFIAGDKYFQPNLMISTLKEMLKDCPADLVYESVELPYPVDHIQLTDDYVVPSGMAWDQNMDEDYGTQKVREYYGRNDTLKGRLSDCDILIIHGAALPASIIDEAKNLKLICCMRGGPVNLDLDYAKSKGILCSNSPGKNAEGVAEYTIGLALSHIRHIPEGTAGLARDQYRQRYGSYDVVGYELEHKKFGLVGFGRIAQKLCRILKGLGCEVLAYDPFQPEDRIMELGAVPCDMDTLLQQSDIISLHARGKGCLIGEKEFAKMKPSVLFINTARGSLVDYKALKAALEQGKISGAALDVFGPEPYSFYRELSSMPNVTATPHMAGVSRETVLRGIEMTGGEIRRFLTGQPLEFQI